jgi:hypothetical protein
MAISLDATSREGHDSGCTPMKSLHEGCEARSLLLRLRECRTDQPLRA